ncbi:MAG: ABC transporter permease [Nitrospiraceae bacterium]|nr:ABC transporter permease [Nitrospiraceae bacterium]
MFRFRGVADCLALALVVVALAVVFGLTTDHFFSASTFKNIANQIPDAMVVATGMTFVLIIGGIDLSVGSVLSLSGAVLGVCLQRLGLPLPVAIAACLGAGLLCGTVNGLLVIRWRLPSFIVTLGMLEIARGATYLLTPQTQYISGHLDFITDTSLLGLSLPFLVALVVVIAGQTVLSGTVFGRHLLALGANEESARLSGVRTRALTLSAFMLSGLLAGVAGLIQCARFSAADPNAGIGFELQAIAAVVIGGTSLMGGRGSVVNSFFGVLVIAVLGVGLFAVGAEESTKRLVTGCVIVAAVILDYYRHRLGRAAPA